MKNTANTMKICVTSIVVMTGLALSAQAADESLYRKLSIDDFRDHLKGGWIGQMAGVGWGQPTEFKVKGRIMLDSEMPPWNPDMVNQQDNDDCYVEQTFIRTLELHGFDVSFKQAGIDFANTKFPLCHANAVGRDNVRRGVAPPDSGHPAFNKHCDDIDYQIEADYSGLISPGCPNSVIALGDKFGRIMNYGDGLYGGQFVGGMYAEAYFEHDMVKVVGAGLKCIPAESQYAEMVRDMLVWYQQDPENWEKTWGLVEEKYHKDKNYTHTLCCAPGAEGGFSIDAKLNGAYIIMGLLYGKGDPDKTIRIACRCGQDSDCNPANAGGVLFASMGYAKVPERFKSALNEKKLFWSSTYDWPTMLKVHEQLGRQVVVKYGGRIETDSSGKEMWVIPVQTAKPGPVEKSWMPGPSAGIKYAEDERATMPQSIFEALEKFAPGWWIEYCHDGTEIPVGLMPEKLGRKNVLVTVAARQDIPCVLITRAEVPVGRKTCLKFAAGHQPAGEWELVVKAEGKELLKKIVGKETAPDGWLMAEVDLTEYAGNAVKLELLQKATGPSHVAGYWADIRIESKDN